jgi:hypothetical protein
MSPTRWDVPTLTAAFAALREDWNPAAIEGALTAALVEGWPPERAILTLIVEATQSDGSPRCLVDATRDPVEPLRPPEPTPDMLAARETARVIAETAARVSQEAKAQRAREDESA